MPIEESELILNPDGSIYHLNLQPEHISETIITVGDPDRVNQVASHFDEIQFKTYKREFHTQTGVYRGKRISVISTGIGTDNIDIVLNELDALVNIDLKKREVKKSLTSLNIIRIGTSGAIQDNIPIDSFLISETAVGFDSLLHFYKSSHLQNLAISKALHSHLNLHQNKSAPYAVNGDSHLISHFKSDKTFTGITGTNVGFYGPQGRKLRLELQDEELNRKISSFRYNQKQITNLEMETAGIYGLSLLLGHRAISMNAIIANRKNGRFSDRPKEVVDDLILYTLDKIVTLN
ncbi:MAG: nucleoside phosphorylase [Bacteroidota bacterium]